MREWLNVCVTVCSWLQMHGMTLSIPSNKRYDCFRGALICLMHLCGTPQIAATIGTFAAQFQVLNAPIHSI